MAKTVTKSKKAAQEVSNIPETDYGVKGVKGAKGASVISTDEANVALMGGLLSGKIPAQQKPSKGKSEKLHYKVPPELTAEMKIVVHGKRIFKAIEKKVKIANDKLKEHFIKQWCEVFFKSGSVPASAFYASDDLSIDFIQTKKVYLKPAAVEQLREMGVKIDDHTEKTGVFINTAPLEEAGLLTEAFNALATVPGMTVEILGKTIQPKFAIKETLYQNLPRVAKESLGPKATDQQVIEQMILIYKALDPVSMLKNPTAPCSFGDSAEEIINTPLVGGDAEDDE